MKCRLLKFRIGASLDAGRPLPAIAEVHLAQCPDCAAWCRAQQDLATRLRQAVPGVEAPPFLQDRILRGIGKHRRKPEPSLWMWRSGAVAAAVAAMVLAIQYAQPDQKTERTGGSRRSAPPPPPILASSSPYFSGGKRWLQSAVAIDQPLRREFTLLKEDGLNTLRALQAGFVPNIIPPQKD